MQTIENIIKEAEFSNLLNKLNINYDNVNVESNSIIDTYSIKVNSSFKISKIDGMLKNIGLELCSKTEPERYIDYENGLFKIKIQHSYIPKNNFFNFKNNHAYKGKSQILAAIGTDLHNKKMYKDLLCLPNLLISGIPGSGKSMLLHSIILSSLLNETKLFLIDTKRVEFSMYNGIKNIKNISIEQKDAESLIEMILDIANNRFKKLNVCCVRNIFEFNLKYKNDPLSPILLIIDEWADLYLQNKKIENSLIQIAQKGRAAGISVVLATQRPSVTVISGLIKSNFPGRIALKTTTATDSRLILDQSGAEKIQEIGVGLYKDNTIISPIMFKTPFIEKLSKEIKELYN